jgi:quaternary ammonium compound-resistance protein SugE
VTNLWPTAGFAACALVSFALLTVALRDLEVGAAYAVWTGIGAAGAATVGMIFLGDAVSALKVVSIGLILAGVIGLNLSGVTPRDCSGLAACGLLPLAAGELGGDAAGGVGRDGEADADAAGLLADVAAAGTGDGCGDAHDAAGVIDECAA